MCARILASTCARQQLGIPRIFAPGSLRPAHLKAFTLALWRLTEHSSSRRTSTTTTRTSCAKDIGDANDVIGVPPSRTLEDDVSLEDRLELRILSPTKDAFANYGPPPQSPPPAAPRSPSVGGQRTPSLGARAPVLQPAASAGQRTPVAQRRSSGGSHHGSNTGKIGSKLRYAAGSPRPGPRAHSRPRPPQQRRDSLSSMVDTFSTPPPRPATPTRPAPMYTCQRGGRAAHLLMNFLLLTASLMLIGTGSALMGFYRVHMLDVITVEFLLVPLIHVVGGILTLGIALFGFYVGFKEDSCLMVTYAVFLALQFVMLVAGIISSIRLLFDIQTGLFDADVIPELNLYNADPWVTYKWDTLQREFSCCGGYGYTQGYTDWKHTALGASGNSVPDSCCLDETPLCGKNIFALTDLRVVIRKIHTHGCLTTMWRRMESHVMLILLVFAIVGGLLAIVELLGIVLACCMASQFAQAENDDDDEWGGPSQRRHQHRPHHVYDYDDDDDPVDDDMDVDGGRHLHHNHLQQQHQTPTRPTTPQTMMSNDLSSHHETAF